MFVTLMGTKASKVFSMINGEPHAGRHYHHDRQVVMQDVSIKVVQFQKCGNGKLPCEPLKQQGNYRSHPRYHVGTRSMKDHEEP